MSVHQINSSKVDIILNLSHPGIDNISNKIPFSQENENDPKPLEPSRFSFFGLSSVLIKIAIRVWSSFTAVINIFFHRSASHIISKRLLEIAPTKHENDAFAHTFLSHFNQGIPFTKMSKEINHMLRCESTKDIANLEIIANDLKLKDEEFNQFILNNLPSYVVLEYLQIAHKTKIQLIQKVGYVNLRYEMGVEKMENQTFELDPLPIDNPDNLASIPFKNRCLLLLQKKDKVQTLEQFRIELNDTINKVRIDVLKKMGCKEPGLHKSVGTPGAASDYDFEHKFNTENHNVSQVFQTSNKFLYDLIAYSIFETLPSFSIDTNSYTSSAANLMTENALETYPQFHSLPKADKHNLQQTFNSSYSRLEEDMVHLQKIRLSSREDWNQYKQARREAFKNNPKYVQSLEQSFNEVEEFEDEVQIGIQNLLPTNISLLDGHAYQEARGKAELTYIIPRLMELSKLMDENAKRIIDLEHQLAFPDANIKTLLSEIAHLKLKQKVYFSLRTTFFPETGFTDGYMNCIVLNSTGQAVITHKNKIQQEIEMKNTQKDEFNTSYQPNVFESREATKQDHLSASKESEILFDHQMSEKINKLPAEDALIYSSKYLLRLVENLKVLALSINANNLVKKSRELFEVMLQTQTDALNDYKSAILPSQILIECENFLFLSTQFEFCKRKSQINCVTTNKLLQDWIANQFEKNPNFNQKNFHKTILEMVQRAIHEFLKDTEPGSQYLDETVKLIEKMCHLCNVLIQNIEVKGHVKGVIKAESLNSLDKELLQILYARCDKKKADSKILEKGKNETLQFFNLNSRENIFNLIKKVKTLSLMVEKLARENGVIVLPEYGEKRSKEFNIALCWNEMKKKK